MSIELVRKNLDESATVLQSFITDENNIKKISDAAQIIYQTIVSEGRVFSCGNGGSMCDAMHFAEELTGRFRENRKAIAAVSISDPSHLSCVANDFGYDVVFSRYLEAHGRVGDVLLAISTSGNSKNVLLAIEQAKRLGMKVVGLTGKDGGNMKDSCDIEIRAPYSKFADRAQEIHIKVIHAIIDSIEHHLLYS